MVRLSNEGELFVWSWIMDDFHPAQRLPADLDGVLVGLAWFCGMLGLVRGQNIGFVNSINSKQRQWCC